MALVSHPSGSGTGPTDRVSTAPGPGLVGVDKSDYIGHDVNEVVDRLRTLHLVPVIQVASAHQPGRPGEVVDLVWRGELRQGSEIIVIAIPNQGRGKDK